jgi:hypothetical protein
MPGAYRKKWFLWWLPTQTITLEPAAQSVDGVNVSSSWVLPSGPYWNCRNAAS